MASVTEQVNSMNPAAPISLLVKHCGAAAGELLDRGLRAAGLLVVVAPTVYDAVIEAERATGSLRHLICCVDYFGRDDFRLFRLVRREWPKTVIVAHYSPGFEYKGRLAELVGADVILGCLEDIANFVEGLAPSAAPTEPEPSRPLAGVSQAIAALRSTAPVAAAPKPAPPHPTAPVEPPARPAPEPPPPPSAPTGLPPTAAYQHLARDPEPPPAANASSPPPSAPPAEVKPAAPPPDDDEWVEGDVIGTVELTEDELRLLLGEEKDA